MKKINWKALTGFFLILMALALDVWAGESGGKQSWGDIAESATNAVGSLGKLITAGSYLAGLAFSISAIMKFKQHKDNPTQVTVGTPIALTFIAAALLFLPSVLSATGSTLFGESGGLTASEKGCTMNKKGECV